MFSKYKMSLSLNVLNHLGMRLYSNIPAVLSETVANSWDADAENVKIRVSDDEIVIEDDGRGMSLQDINDKYLTVGYEKRLNESITPKHSRHVMGRKGIGKLSLFSIAGTIEIQTLKDGDAQGFVMSYNEIREKITKTNEDYHPNPLPKEKIVIKQEGTRIALTDLTKKVYIKSLRKQLARRFSIISPQNNFCVFVNDTPVSVSERNYFHKLQCLWHYGKYGKDCLDLCHSVEHCEERENKISEKPYSVSGWIGAVKEAGDVKDEDDSLNKITIMIRGKLAQEDILEEFFEGGVYTKYLMGEIRADFLDEDDEDDIATSNRQQIIKDDPRYKELKIWLQKELKNIQKSWNNYRSQAGTKQACTIPAVEEWFLALKGDSKKKAQQLFGKINTITLNSEKERRVLFAHSVLAFESLRYKERLDTLDKISPDNIPLFTEIFADLNDIESTLYYQIVKERLKVIDALRKKTDNNALEKLLQQHIYEHLWLLDPSWERAATITPVMEQSVKKAFEGINAKLSDKEKKGRVDIRYQTSAGKHIIIELKRANRSVDSPELQKQVTKYIRALKKILREMKKTEPVEAIAIVGKELKDWEDEETREESRKSLEAYNIRVVLYKELIQNAYESYNLFLEKNQEAGRVSKLIQQIQIDE